MSRFRSSIILSLHHRYRYRYSYPLISFRMHFIIGHPPCVSILIPNGSDSRSIFLSSWLAISRDLLPPFLKCLHLLNAGLFLIFLSFVEVIVKIFESFYFREQFFFFLDPMLGWDFLFSKNYQVIP